MQLKTMTFNIHHGRGTDGVLDLNRIAAVIKASGADLVALNEVDRHYARRSQYVDQASWLAETLHMHVAYGAAISLASPASPQQRQYGNALLSRYPIVAKENYCFRFSYVENRSLLEVMLAHKDTPFKTYVTHLSLEPFTHKKQTNFIIDKIQQEQYPVLLLGDWNMKPGASAWKKLGKYMQDAWTVCGEGRGCTYPSHVPKSRIDYIFASHHFRILSTEVYSDVPAASDHLPLVATVELEGEEGTDSRHNSPEK